MTAFTFRRSDARDVQLLDHFAYAGNPGSNRLGIVGIVHYHSLGIGHAAGKEMGVTELRPKLGRWQREVAVAFELHDDPHSNKFGICGGGGLGGLPNNW